VHLLMRVTMAPGPLEAHSIRSELNSDYVDAVAEHVVATALGVVWDPNDPAAVLISDDSGRNVLAMNHHPDDEDQRSVVLTWKGVRSAAFSDPNDEAVSGHRLHRRGLSDVLWIGLVRESETIRALELLNTVHPRHDPSRFERLSHHVVLLKECVAEVVAETIEVRRVDGSTLEAGARALRS